MRNLWVALFALLTLMGCSKGDGKKETQAVEALPASTTERTPEDSIRIRPEMLRDLHITTAAVELRPGGDGVHLLGELKVNEDSYAEVGAPVAGRVTAIHATSGQYVEKGQQLATLQIIELGKVRADLVTAQARLEFARKTLERKRRLAGEKIVAEREVQEAEASLATAEADVRSSRATMAALGAREAKEEGSDGSQLVLRSPVAGTVIERAVVQGQMADPARPLFRISDMSALWLTVHAFERDAVRVREGVPARVSFAALPGRVFVGRVSLVGKQVDLDSRTVLVRIDVQNAGELLRPGMSATAWVTLGKGNEQVIAVPTAALQRVEDAWVVFMPKGGGTFEVRTVGRGRELGGEVEILSGLRMGEKVVVEGAFLLKAEADKLKGEGKEHAH